MTNFERIKAMSVEELAKEFDCNRCINYGPDDCFKNDDSCNVGKIAYLNAESEE